ncbi:hypothetical protein BV22DRAFT_850183 [Leucogyrophana mollusca]|uniref:Uncharacterized protein n=1 Tax=Leucogyrophana mollusca TaxID=85980 RepID=A0ACB8B2K2_9AGAM|nr:hypothetical protein BV22DRAFT_850183 [Leucogyrophana mollusca]
MNSTFTALYILLPHPCPSNCLFPCRTDAPALRRRKLCFKAAQASSSKQCRTSTKIAMLPRRPYASPQLVRLPVPQQETSSSRRSSIRCPQHSGAESVPAS